MTGVKGIEIVEKIDLKDKNDLSLIYTPGVSSSCLAIHKNTDASFIYTNRINSVAVLSNDYQKSLHRAIFLKSTLLIDAYPLCVKDLTIENLKFVVENIEPTFNAIDLSLIDLDLSDCDFNVSIPVLKTNVKDLKGFFHCIARTAFLNNSNHLKGSIQEQSLQLRELYGGVIETQLSEEIQKKPIAIISDGSAILGLGNIGAEAGLPVMEGKAFLFKALGNVNAMPLCLKTQNTEELIKLALLLQNSFSGINLEDIAAPKCFEVEQKLIKKAEIAIFHDDQHGAAICILAALLNALHLVKKEIEKVKIVFSGAGAAAQATCRLLLSAGVKNIILSDINGIVYQGRAFNDSYLEDIAQITNLNNIKGTLAEALDGADVFIGLSVGNILTEQMIKKMTPNPIIFALANPTPEIEPKKAKNAGASIVATGRSDFENQINNALVFPGLFKGILDSNIKTIKVEDKLNCAFTLASMVTDEELSEDYIIPEALNLKVALAISNTIKGDF